MNRNAAEFMQYLRPVGFGPSGKTWPRCESPSLAPHLGAAHEETPVYLLHDVIRFKRLCKAWPARAGFEFVTRTEERLPGDNVDVDALPDDYPRTRS